MRQNKAYLHLKKKGKNPNFECYILYYVVDIAPGFYAHSITPNPTEVTFNDVDEEHKITLKVKKGNKTDNVPRDGAIKIKGVSEIKTCKYRVKFEVDKPGSIGGNGSVGHYADADE